MNLLRRIERLEAVTDRRYRQIVDRWVDTLTDDQVERVAQGSENLATAAGPLPADVKTALAYLVHVYTDAGLSGGRADNRPGLQAALDAACKTKAALIVYSLTRLSRSTRDALAISERLDKAGADLVSLSERIDTTTAAGKMVFRMLAVLAEFERDQISERTRTAMQHKRTRCEYTGGRVPYGWRLAADGVTLEPEAAEQAIMGAAHELRAAGLSLRAIGAQLEAEGLLPRNGTRWHAKTVRDLLTAQRAA